MTFRVRLPAYVRDEILRLRGEQRLTYAAIGAIVGVHPVTVGNVCWCHYDDAVARAAAELRREINLARSERHTAELFHPEKWG